MNSLVISSYCIIRKGIVITQDKRFEFPGFTNDGKFLKEIFKHLESSYAKFYKMDRLSKLAFLASEFPGAEIIRDGAPLATWVEAILAHLDGKLPHLDLPLDVQATAFQMRVWEELHKIPYGETRTYAQVAAAIDQPAAVRAVGRACATNPASIVTPCHRVIRSDGSLGGYRWGLDRKQALLDRERN